MEMFRLTADTFLREILGVQPIAKRLRFKQRSHRAGDDGKYYGNTETIRGHRENSARKSMPLASGLWTGRRGVAGGAPGTGSLILHLASFDALCERKRGREQFTISSYVIPCQHIICSIRVSQQP